MAIKKAQTGAAVKKTVAPKAKPVVKPAAKKLKEVPREWKYTNDPYDVNNPKSSQFSTAQAGKTVKKTPVSNPRINMAVPGMGLPPANPKKIESMSARSGKTVKKYQMGGFVSNEFAAKHAVKKPATKSTSKPSTKKGGNNMLIPGMGLPSPFDKTTETASAKVGKTVKKAQTGTIIKKKSTGFKKTPQDIKDEKANKGRAVGVVISKEDEKKHPEDFKYLKNKNGGKMKKAQSGAAVKTPPVNPPAGATPGSGYKSFGKSGVSVKKCKHGCK